MEVKKGRKFIGRFASGNDLLESLTSFCVENNISLGVFTVIGAVKCAKMGYYDQAGKEYTDCVEVNRTLEISSCIGNISMKDSEVFVHAHVTFSDHEGKCYGGHLMPGAKIFAAEYFIEELTGGELIREADEETGLSLWQNY